MSFSGLHHVQVRTQDMEASIAFYREVFGFEVESTWSHGEYQLVDMRLGAMILELGTGFIPPSEPDGLVNHFALRTDDMEDAFAKLVARGTQLISPGIERGNRGSCDFLFLLLRSPSGEKIELIQELR